MRAAEAVGAVPTGSECVGDGVGHTRSEEGGAALCAPILTSFTARVAGTVPRALLSSPAALARATVETQRLIGQSVVLCVYDANVLCEACRASAGGAATARALTSAGPERAAAHAPISVLLEAVPQIRAGLPADAHVLLTVAGPGTLYRQLRECDAEQTSAELEAYVVGASIAVANAAFAAGADGIALIERFDADIPSRVLRAHRTLRKLTDFHAATLTGFATAGEAPDDVFDQLFDLTRGDEPIVVARCRAGASAWACTREDVPGNLDVAQVQAMVATQSATPTGPEQEITTRSPS